MAISIKDPLADRSARELAEATGKSITEAVLNALREQLRRETGRAAGSTLAEELRSIGERCAALPDLDTRSADEIIGYDERGVPAGAQLGH